MPTNNLCGLDYNTTSNCQLSNSSSMLLSNRYQVAATSDNTRRAYQADVRHFERWGVLRRASKVPVLAI